MFEDQCYSFYTDLTILFHTQKYNLLLLDVVWYEHFVH